MQVHGSKAELKAQAKLEEAFWARAHRFRWLFQICPHLSWVGVCNSLPMKNLKPGSDIDLFVVTKPGRLFTARLWLTILTSLLGVRRHGSKVEKRFCLSFFVEEGHEGLEDIALEQDIYLARWVATLRPIAGDAKSYEQFLEKNRNWARALVGELTPHWEHHKSPNPFQALLKALLSLPTLPFEEQLRSWQMKRALEKAQHLSDRRGTLITAHRLKFHDTDRRAEYRELWLKSDGGEAENSAS